MFETRPRYEPTIQIMTNKPKEQYEMNVCAFLDLIGGLSRQQQFIIFIILPEI